METQEAAPHLPSTSAHERACPPSDRIHTRPPQHQTVAPPPTHRLSLWGALNPEAHTPLQDAPAAPPVRFLCGVGVPSDIRMCGRQGLRAAITPLPRTRDP